MECSGRFRGDLELGPSPRRGVIFSILELARTCAVACLNMRALVGAMLHQHTAHSYYHNHTLSPCST